MKIRKYMQIYVIYKGKRLSKKQQNSYKGIFKSYFYYGCHFCQNVNVKALL